MEGDADVPIEVDTSSYEEEISIPDDVEEINWAEALVLADVLSDTQGQVYENEFAKEWKWC